MRAARLGSGRSILIFLALTVIAWLAMQPALHELTNSGTSIAKLEYAGSASEAKRIHDSLSGDAKQAAYVQLFLDLPFLIGYGGLIASICLWTANLVQRTGRITAAGLLTLAAWLGPLAAGFDVIQNVALAFVLGGHTGQPAPRIAALSGYGTWTCVVLAALVVATSLAAWAGVWRKRAAPPLA